MAKKFPATRLQGLFKDLTELLGVNAKHIGGHFDNAMPGGLKKNIWYETGKDMAGKPRYDYVTDDLGRLRGGYADLKLKPDGQKRGKHNSKSLAKEALDDAGHIFADRFDGSGQLDNIVSQARKLNQGAWNRMEAGWADALASGKRVEAFIDIKYNGDALRPSGFTVHEMIDNNYVVREFANVNLPEYAKKAHDPSWITQSVKDVKIDVTK